MKQSERVETLASTKVAYPKKRLGGGFLAIVRGVAGRSSRSDSTSPGSATKSGFSRSLIEQYGPPDEATPMQLIWHGNGLWKRTVEIPHKFPTAHTDFVSQYIDYQVPPEKVSDLVAFDGSVLIDRTAGEMGSPLRHGGDERPHAQPRARDHHRQAGCRGGAGALRRLGIGVRPRSRGAVRRVAAVRCRARGHRGPRRVDHRRADGATDGCENERRDRYLGVDVGDDGGSGAHLRYGFSRHPRASSTLAAPNAATATTAVTVSDSQSEVS